MDDKHPVVQHSLDQYMLEVGRIPLLSREEEKKLAEQLKEGSDTEAARRLVASNLRFVIKVAFQYKNYNIRMTDLIQEGNVGLMHAVSKFDPDRGYRLISYAVWWIKAYIQNYIIKNWSMVPISARRKHLFGKRKPKTGDDLEPDDNDGEHHYLISAEKAREQLVEVSRKEVMLAQRDFSLDAAVSNDSTTTHLARLPSPAPSAEDNVGQQQVREQVTRAIAEVIDHLDERGRYILENRLVSDDPMSLAQIGKHYGISRERARQLEARVKQKLKKALSHLGEAEIRG
jgi:RNA polymerase sigma-32 factor